MTDLSILRFISGALVLLTLGACTASTAGSGGGPVPVATLKEPTSAEFSHPAPERFDVLFETSQGEFVVEVHRGWAPLGAERFYNLVRAGYYDGLRFFRVIPGFVAQFGIHAEPGVNEAWRSFRIPDDPVVQPNRRGTLTFATAGRDTRTVELFLNLADNVHLDAYGFAPIGVVISGMDAVERLFSGYGEGAPRGQGPDQGRLQAEGEDYLSRDFPQLSRILSARVVSSAGL